MLAEVTVQNVISPEGQDEEVAGEEEDLQDIVTSPNSPPVPSEGMQTPLGTAEEQRAILRSAQAILEREGLLDKALLEALSVCCAHLA